MQRVEFPAATTAWAEHLDPRLEVPAGGDYPGGDDSEATEFVVIVRTGGSPQTKITENAQLTFMCYGPDRGVAEKLASKTSSLVYAAAGSKIGVDPVVECKRVTNVSAPSYQRDPDRPDLERYVFTVLTALKGAIVSEGTAA